jgi:hypothetical protein
MVNVPPAESGEAAIAPDGLAVSILNHHVLDHDDHE